MTISVGKEYPFRQQIMEEIHARPVEPVPALSRVRRLVFVVPPDPGSVAATLKRFCDWCAGAGLAHPCDKDARQHSFVAGSRQVTWRSPTTKLC